VTKIPFEITLQPKQWQLMQAILAVGDVPTVLGYGGSRGAAKSGGVRRIALGLAMKFPGTIVWIMRRVWDDLNKDHVMPLFEEFPQFKPYWLAGNKELRIPHENGKASSIFFIHAGDTGRAKRKARGPQAHFIFLEQAEEFSKEEIEQLDGSNRAPGSPPGFCKKILTFNPGGIGTNYLRRVMWKREFMDNESPKDFLFIQGFGWDNYEWFRGLGTVTQEEFYRSPEWTSEKRFKVFIEQTDFGRKLNKLPPAQRIGELMGDFENFAGQYYADVWEPSVIVLPVDIVSRIIKPWWRRWLATDWGFSHYAATGWFASGMLSVEEIADYFGVAAIAPVRILLQYRELVVCDVPEPNLARVILAQTPEVEKREIRYNFMGQDAWAKRGSANTVVEQMDPILRSGGLPPLDKADWDRVGGWRLIYNALDSARRLVNWGGGSITPFEEDPEDVPALFISAACPETIQAIPSLVCDYDPITRPNGDPKDVRKMSGQVYDDVADMVRYAMKSYLKAEPGLPKEVHHQELRQRYPDTAEGNTRYAMRRLVLDAEAQRGQYLHRKVRG
jgi:hypothetical protein